MIAAMTDNAKERVVDVCINGRLDVLTMTVERAHARLVEPFFSGVTVDDVWQAAHGGSGWQGTLASSIVSITKANGIRDSDVVLR